MGVRGLWNILAPVQEYRPLAELSGEIVAVDLSIWVCGDISTNQNTPAVLKLYLRYEFPQGSATARFCSQLVGVIQSSLL